MFRHVSTLLAFWWIRRVSNWPGFDQHILVYTSGQISSQPHTTSPQKVAFWKGKSLISGKSRLVKFQICFSKTKTFVSCFFLGGWIFFSHTYVYTRFFSRKTLALNIAGYNLVTLNKNQKKSTTWRIIPVSKWLTTMVSFRPLNGVIPLINGPTSWLK